MANSLTQYATAGEARTARELVRAALARGLSISVNDGYETTLSRSQSFRAITDALATTEEDYLTMFAPDGDRIGFFHLVYGNEADGSTLICDHTDNEACERLYNAAHRDTAKEEAQERIGNIWDAQDRQDY